MTAIFDPLNPSPKKRATIYQQKPTSIEGLRLSQMLLLPVLLSALTSIGIGTWVSQQGQQAINEVTSQLRVNTSTQVQQSILRLLNEPHTLSEGAAAAIGSGQVDPETIERYFWQLLQNSPVNFLQFSNPQGLNVAVRRNSSGSYESRVRDSLDQPIQTHHELNDRGQRVRAFIPQNPDSITRPLGNANIPKESNITPFFIRKENNQPNKISFSIPVPVYNEQSQLLGVVDNIVDVKDAHRSLKSLKIGRTGQVFILERTGDLITTSLENYQQPFKIEGSNIVERIQAIDATDPLISQTTRQLISRFGDLKAINIEQMDFNLQGRRQFVQTIPITDPKGIDWLGVIVVPESDFLGQVGTNTHQALILMVVAALLAILLGVWIANQITRSLTELSKAASGIAQGRFDQQVDPRGVNEIRGLAQVFNQMTQQLRIAFDNFKRTNAALNQQSGILQKANTQMQQDAEIWQEDVGHILEVVSSVEEGDLTVQAQVNNRATGLVADILNRLIDRLAQVLSTVQSSVLQVASATGQLEQKAITVSEDARQQTQSVQTMQGLIEQVGALSQSALQQAQATAEAAQHAQSAVTQGQEQMQSMISGIADLRQGSDQIIKRTQTLASFLELTDQFSRDQKRVAAMTRVLALNASMLAARASGQQDPEQFASIAREFETIAGQVNELAAQTGQSLIRLQQQTEQIQTVVSGLGQDVQQIDHLVQGFSTGVQGSQQVFDRTQAVTEQVAQLGQQVTDASQQIAQVTQRTLQAMQAIATSAAATEQQAVLTREQSAEMGELARQLLELISFFRLQQTPDPANGHLTTSPSLLLRG